MDHHTWIRYGNNLLHLVIHAPNVPWVQYTDIQFQQLSQRPTQKAYRASEQIPCSHQDIFFPFLLLMNSIMKITFHAANRLLASLTRSRTKARLFSIIGPPCPSHSRLTTPLYFMSTRISKNFLIFST